MDASSIVVPESKDAGIWSYPWVRAPHSHCLALRISRLLVSQGFAWGAPVLHISISVPPNDWYWQHFELSLLSPR